MDFGTLQVVLQTITEEPDIGGDKALKRYKPIYALNGSSFYAYWLDTLRYERSPQK